MKDYLIDTNIFLEILLGQDKKESCKSFIVNNFGRLPSQYSVIKLYYEAIW